MQTHIAKKQASAPTVRKSKILIIGVDKNGLVSFQNLQDFIQIELMGILHCALATADVLYKTKVMQSIDVAMKELQKGV